MNKKLIIILSVLFVAGLIGLGIFSYLNSKSPIGVTKTVTSLTADDSARINEHLTDNFINRINNDSPSSKEFLDNNVSNYTVKKSVRSTRILSEAENQATVEIVVRIVTTNNRTGFEVVTLDTYQAKLLKENGNWKIDEYSILNSKTETK